MKLLVLRVYSKHICVRLLVSTVAIIPSTHFSYANAPVCNICHSAASYKACSFVANCYKACRFVASCYKACRFVASCYKACRFVASCNTACRIVANKACRFVALISCNKAWRFVASCYKACCASWPACIS